MVAYNEEAMESVQKLPLRGAGISHQIQEPNLLIVEGRDEQFFFEAALRDHLGLADIQVMPAHRREDAGDAKSHGFDRGPGFCNGCVPRGHSRRRHDHSRFAHEFGCPGISIGL